MLKEGRVFMQDRCLDFHFCQTRLTVIRINTQVMLCVEKKKERKRRQGKEVVCFYLFIFCCCFFNIQSYLFFITHGQTLS